MKTCTTCDLAPAGASSAGDRERVVHATRWRITLLGLAGCSDE